MAITGPNHYPSSLSMGCDISYETDKEGEHESEDEKDSDEEFYRQMSLNMAMDFLERRRLSMAFKRWTQGVSRRWKFRQLIMSRRLHILKRVFRGFRIVAKRKTILLRLVSQRQRFYLARRLLERWSLCARLTARQDRTKASSFKRRSAKQRCLRAFHRHAQRAQQRKKARNIAELYRHSIIKTRAFRVWKEYRQRWLLVHAAARHKGWVSVLRPLAARLVTRWKTRARNRRLLRRVFALYESSWEKVSEVLMNPYKEHFRVLIEVFTGWRSYALRRVRAREYVARVHTAEAFARGALLSRTFCGW